MTDKEKTILKNQVKKYKEAVIIIRQKIRDEMNKESSIENYRAVSGLRAAMEIMESNWPDF